MRKTAAVLMIAAGVLNLLYGTVALTGLVDIKEAVRFLWVISPLAYFGFANGFTGKAALSNILMSSYLLGIMISIVGGIVFLLRNTVGSRLIGVIGSLLCFPLLGLASAVLTIFRRPKPAG